MRKPILLLLLTLPFPALAQSVLTIDTAQCLWHPGDDPAWAVPNLDESSWQPYSQWKLDPDQPRIWLRCHADLSTLRDMANPAIQVSMQAAYQLYLNGVLIGGAGNTQSGSISLNTIHSLPLGQESLLASPPAAIVLRLTYRSTGISADTIPPPPSGIRAGDQLMLDALRAARIQAQIPIYFINLLCYTVIAVLGFVLLGQFLQDRERYDLLLLSISTLSQAAVWAVNFCISALVALPIAAAFAITGASLCLQHIAGTIFFFAMARKRTPLLFWALIVLSCVYPLSRITSSFLPAGQALWIAAFGQKWLLSTYYGISVATGFAPFVAFWPYRSMARRTMPLALLSMAWGALEMLQYSARPAGLISLLGVPTDVLVKWHIEVANVRAIVTAGIMIALMTLLSRHQQRTARERAELAGELHAASQIQRMLAPAILDSTPGMQIEVAFHPMREVGGDFYLCRVLQDGRQRVVIGDVSGKGSAAAMTAALLLGAAGGRDTDSPADLLAHLNRILMEARVSGFATCLCADVAADGMVTLANAGHLSPYTRGQEIYTPPSLPLGLNPRISNYELIEFPLASGETLTFLSDGVVEARSKVGELFGFDQARTISGYPASHIAKAAQDFGQEDDITVLTLSRQNSGQPATAAQTQSAFTRA